MAKERADSAFSIKPFIVIFRAHSITIEGIESSKVDNATKTPNHDSKIEINNDIP